MLKSRAEAGRRLAERLARYRNEHPLVLGLPRGGVVVAYEIAHALDAPLDVLVVRKLGAPGHPELGIGAVTDGEDPEVLLNQDVVQTLGVEEAYLRREAAARLAEVRRRQALLRGGQPALAVRDRTVIVVDDGVATGGTVRAAVRAVRRHEPRRIVLAVGVAPPDVLEALRAEVDDVECLESPRDFRAVGHYYADFRQMSEGEVISLLGRESAAPGHFPSGVH